MVLSCLGQCVHLQTGPCRWSEAYFVDKSAQESKDLFEGGL